MPPRRHSERPLTTVDDIYKEYARSLVSNRRKKHVVEFLANQSESWKRLYPQTNLIVSEAETSVETPPLSQIDADNGTPSNIASTCHQPPQESPNSRTSSGMQRIQDSATISGDIATCLPAETPSLPQIYASKDSPPNIASTCHQSPDSSTSSVLGEIQYSETIAGDIGICKMSDQENIEVPPCDQPSREFLLDSIMTKIVDSIEEPASNFDGSDTPFRQSQQVAKDRLVQELECIVKECEAKLCAMPGLSSDDNADSEHLRTCLTKITEKSHLFYESMKQSLTEISKMVLSPILNISSLSILNSNVLNVAIDVEKIWREYAELGIERSISHQRNMTHHYYWCWQYYEAYRDINQRYLNSLPEKLYPTKRENFSVVY